MKKYFLALSFFLISCSTENFNVLNKTPNKNCMDMKRFKIFQTFPANYALAHNCEEEDRNYCFGAIVLLTPQQDIDYYDDMFVVPQTGKCAIQDGIYRYESKNGLNTVPKIRWAFKYEPENEEEATAQLKEYMENSINECKLIYASEKETNTEENMKKCDCSIKEAFKYRFQKLNDNEIFIEDLIKSVEEKCGKVPEFF